MCKSIALLSGKGGSGKTTLALSMATLLSECRIRVLLVDCDLSTNGATYFYEDKLATAKSIYSFYDLMSIKIQSDNDAHFVKINEWYHFLPSITQISEASATNHFSISEEQCISFFQQIRNTYDVILFDCQAGYTDILKVILPLSDIGLIIMETDAISSASVRSLYLKIGNIINDKKTFQIFNKASKEEFEIYSKLSGGTVFTPAATILFDWKIRQAFAVAQVPDVKNTNVDYGEQIFKLCQIFFSQNDTLNKKLIKFEDHILLNRYKEEIRKTQEKMLDLKLQSTNNTTQLMKPVLLGILSVFLLLISILYNKSSQVQFPVDFTNVLLSVLFASTMGFLADALHNVVRARKNMKRLEHLYFVQRADLDRLSAQIRKKQASSDQK